MANRSLSKGKAATYRYTAFTGDGKLVKGNISAASEAAAEELLVGRGYEPAILTPTPPLLSAERLFPTVFGVKSGDVVVFSRQLATLLESGVTILTALELIQEQMASNAFRRVILAVLRDLRTGASLSQALSRHPQVFNDIYCRTIAVGEQTGGLETMLKQMAHYQERQNMTSKKVSHALAYPVTVLIIALLVSVVLITVALPPMVAMFESLGSNLPLPTRILIGLTNFLGAYKFYLLSIVALTVAAFIWYVRQPSGRWRFHRLLLRAPLIGPPSHMGELARFTRTMSVLLSAGLPLQEVMEMVPQTSGNTVIRGSLQQVQRELLQGQGLSGPMSKIDVFPDLLVQMAIVGEESSTLDTTMATVADFYEANAEEKVNALVGFIQPAMTILIALITGFIAISVIMPMYSITGAFG